MVAILFSKSDKILDGCAELRAETVKGRNALTLGVDLSCKMGDGRSRWAYEKVLFTRRYHGRMSSYICIEFLRLIREKGKSNGPKRTA